MYSRKRVRMSRKTNLVKSPGRKAWVFLFWEWLFARDLQRNIKRGRGEGRVIGFENGDLVHKDLQAGRRIDGVRQSLIGLWSR